MKTINDLVKEQEEHYMNVGDFMAKATLKEIAEFIQYGGRTEWFKDEMNEPEPEENDA